MLWTTKTRILTGFVALLGLGMGGCGDDTTTLTLGMAGLEDLGASQIYESWLIVDGMPVSAGRFSVDADGNPSPATVDLDPALIEGATTYVLTIEPATGDDPGPSNVHILAGDISGGSASITTNHMAALGTDFSSAAGSYILETPSSAAVTDDYNQGIWWLAPGMPPTSSLTLPDLPDGWVYEGWVVGASGPVSTGTFSGASGADSDAAGPDAGPDTMLPPFPGQDFITPAQDLTSGYAAVISVEPVPDNSPMPFLIKPLMHMAIADVMAPATQTMVNIVSMNLPSGSITLGN